MTPPGSRTRIGALLIAGASALALVAAPAVARAQTAPAPPPAGVQPAPQTTDIEPLLERAAQFWAARVAGEPTKQWELLEPRGRGKMTVAEYAGVPRVVKYLAYQVEDASLDGYFATVKVRLIVLPVLPTAPNRRIPPTAVVVGDRWVRIKGVWYRTLEQQVGGPPGQQ